MQLVSDEWLIKPSLQHRMIDSLYPVSVIGCTCCFFLSDWLEIAMLGGQGGDSGAGLDLKAMHGKKVIEMESKHRRKIITCQAWAILGNELHLT